MLTLLIGTGFYSTEQKKNGIKTYTELDDAFCVAGVDVELRAPLFFSVLALFLLLLLFGNLVDFFDSLLLVLLFVVLPLEALLFDCNLESFDFAFDE